MRCATVLLALFALLGSPFCLAADDASAGLRAGASAVDITPTQFPVRAIAP